MAFSVIELTQKVTDRYIDIGSYNCINCGNISYSHKEFITYTNASLEKVVVTYIQLI